MIYTRQLNIRKTNSFFLFGARGTGKSTLIGGLFSPDEAIVLDLLDQELFGRLVMKPSELSDILDGVQKKWCVIDEVQKIPELLDVVHQQIEKKKIKFVLTGSSARKLKRSSANMLGGRAFLYKLFPLTSRELGDDFDLNEVLSFGSLAKIREFSDTDDKILFLKSYVETYLKEEVLVEQLIRSLPPFKKFLEISAANDTEIVQYSSIARDVRSNPNSITNYYSILEDTLLGFFLEPYHTSIRKRQKTSPKFYWFDTGVRRALAGTIDLPIIPQSFEYGSLFESFIVNEIHRLLVYSGKSFKLSYLRIDDNIEIDLIIERAGFPTFLVEIKSALNANANHTNHLNHYAGDFKNSVPMLISLDRTRRKIGETLCLHWTEALEELGL
jgi:predicted AAA+ superfamily ATPase